MDVMFYEAFEEEQKELKKLLPKDIKAEYTHLTIQEHGNKTIPAKLISVRTQSIIPTEWASRLKATFSRTRGPENLALYLKETGSNVLCGGLPSYCARAVAEHAVMVMFSLLRNLKRQIRHFETFNRNNLTGSEAKGKNVFVIGVGCIGSEVIDIARGLSMNVVGNDITKRIKNFDYVLLEEGVIWADVVFNALPWTSKTNNLLNYKLFSLSKNRPIFISTSRNEISPIADLKKLLDENKLSAMGLDNFEKEGILSNYLRGNLSEDKITIETKIELE
ncbi:hydroxyacid dehydrogenase, partial [bacterium]|nr:hydroxyacid dehydrogenase [bacterium]